jgi:hypothetical protein
MRELLHRDNDMLIDSATLLSTHKHRERGPGTVELTRNARARERPPVPSRIGWTGPRDVSPLIEQQRLAAARLEHAPRPELHRQSMELETLRSCDRFLYTVRFESYR